MWFSLSDQTAYFLWSLVLGLAVGAAYDLVRAVRMLTGSGGARVILSDILFFVLCGVVTSLFALPFNKGSVRGFIVFGEVIGFLSYRLTLGSVMGRVYAQLAQLLRVFSQKIRKFLENFFNFLLKAITVLLYNISVIIDKCHILIKKIKKKRAEHRRSGVKRQHKDKKHEQKKPRKAAHRSKKSRKAGKRPG